VVGDDKVLTKGGEIMTKTELYELVAREAGIPKVRAEKAVNAFLRAIRETTLKKGEEVVIPGFGKFYASTLPSRKVKVPEPGNPGTYLLVKAGPTKVIRFKPYKGARKAVR